MEAVGKGHVPVCELLLDRGADVELKNTVRIIYIIM